MNSKAKQTHLIRNGEDAGLPPFLCQPGTTQLFLNEEKNRLDKVLDILTITK